MKVHIVTNANRALYSSELEQMHRLRHKVFVEELGWSALASPDRFEADEFDDQHAVYLIACRKGEVHGSVRLLPSWRRCMITQCFSEWLSDGRDAPTGPDAWEWTRWCPGSVSSPRHLIRSRSALILGALEFAISRNIETYMTFCETKFVGQMEELGWRPKPLCLPRTFEEGGVALAVSWKMHSSILADTRRVLRTNEPVSFEAPFSDAAWIEPAALEELMTRPRQSISARKVIDLETAQIEGRA